nr:type I restriction-modification enzyme R subunit C-terminal domain-containing protein [Phaeodactylibacter luteus]
MQWLNRFLGGFKGSQNLSFLGTRNFINPFKFNPNNRWRKENRLLPIVWHKVREALKFTEDQMQWLRMIKDHIAGSFHLEMDDLDYTPFDAVGGRGRMYQLFGAEMNGVIEELNEVLVA